MNEFTVNNFNETQDSNVLLSKYTDSTAMRAHDRDNAALKADRNDEYGSRPAAICVETTTSV